MYLYIYTHMFMGSAYSDLGEFGCVVLGDDVTVFMVAANKIRRF